MRGPQRFKLLLLAASAYFILWFFLTHRADRAMTGRYGTPLLAGPLAPGGPTFGESVRADLEVSSFGWEFHIVSTPPIRRDYAPYVEIQNKSDRRWDDVVVNVEVTDAIQHHTKYHIPVGALRSGETRRGRGAVIPNYADSFQVTIEGVTGR